MNATPAEPVLYDDLTQALGELGSDLPAAEAHGILCGMLCDPARFQPDLWISQLVGEDDRLVWADLAQGHPLFRMLATTLRELNDQSFSLRLLLPDDDEALATRAGALGDWCRGFLLGFGLQVGARPMSDEAADMLQDLVKISRIDAAEAEDDGNEFAFNDVLEYVRLGALMLQAEIREQGTDPSYSLH